MLHNRPVYAWQMLAQQFKSRLAVRAAPFVRFFSAVLCRPCKCCAFAYLSWQNLDITAQRYPYSRQAVVVSLLLTCQIPPAKPGDWF
jgi:hypothetical protein